MDIISSLSLFFTRLGILEIIAVLPEPPRPTTNKAGAVIRTGTSAMLFIMRNTASLELLSIHNSLCMTLIRSSLLEDKKLRMSGLT